MKRTMLQLYLKNCDAAIALYVKAFGATVDAIHRNPQTNLIAHAEITVFGQCVSFMECESEVVVGNTMQFCFHFGEGGHEATIQKAYDVLKDGAKIEMPLGACEWSPCIFSLVDRFGVNWLLFV